MAEGEPWSVERHSVFAQRKRRCESQAMLNTEKVRSIMAEACHAVVTKRIRQGDERRAVETFALCLFCAYAYPGAV